MAPRIDSLETARSERVAAVLDNMLSQESPAEPADLVDILSGSDEEVAFTAGWKTFTTGRQTRV